MVDTPRVRGTVLHNERRETRDASRLTRDSNALELASGLDLGVAILAISRRDNVITMDAPIDVVLDQHLCSIHTAPFDQRSKPVVSSMMHLSLSLSLSLSLMTRSGTQGAPRTELSLVWCSFDHFIDPLINVPSE